MKRAILCYMLLCFAAVACAQNWQTARLNDTVYFSAGKHYSYGGHYYNTFLTPGAPDSSLLRISYITSATGNGGDSSYYFYTTPRDSSLTLGFSNPCIDSVAPSWLGKRLLRKQDGTEYYFNSRADTIIIQTQAATGSSWIIAKDTAGRLFKATVAAVGTTLVDGIADSFRTISIQAYSGSVPVSNPYNTKVFQISKSHGWLKTLDLFRFPNTFFNFDRVGIAIDSTQHFRMPATLMKPGPTTEDIAWKYTPGNEWIWQDDREVGNNPDQRPQTTTVTHDSVTAFSLIGPNVGIATMHTVTFKRYHYFFPNSQGSSGGTYSDSTSTTAYFHTDTVRSIPSNPIVLIEHGPLGSGLVGGPIRSRYYTRRFDSARYFITRSDLSPFFVSRNSGCITFGPSLQAPDDESRYETYLPGFGQTAAFFMSGTSGAGGQQVIDGFWRYLYIKAGTTTYGTKISVATLATSNTALKTPFRIAPNPAKDFISISADGITAIRATLMSVTGQLVYRRHFAGNLTFVIPVTEIPVGFYFLELAAGSNWQTFKVLIQH